MTPRDDMTIRIATHLSQQSEPQLRAMLQDLVLHVQEEFPDMSDELRDEINRAKALLAQGVQ